MDSTKVSSNYRFDITKNGITANQRCSYTIHYPEKNETINISIKQEDCDKFEKNMDTINQYGKKLSDPKENKKRKIKAYATFLGAGLAGIIIPAVITRNAKPIINSLAMIAGATVGVPIGMFGFLKCMIPAGVDKVTEAEKNIASLDIKNENLNKFLYTG